MLVKIQQKARIVQQDVMQRSERKQVCTTKIKQNEEQNKTERVVSVMMEETVTNTDWGMKPSETVIRYQEY